MAKKTLGIIGGGQLGRMLTEAAHKLGYKVIVIDPNENCPAAQVGAEQIKAKYKDSSAYKILAEKSDIITIEIEHIETSELENLKAIVYPNPRVIRLIQDKYEQKLFLQNSYIKVAKFSEVGQAHSLSKYKRDTIIKTKKDGFDGRGNLILQKNKLLESILSDDPAKYYVEEKIDFDCELSVIYAQDIHKNLRFYPVTKTIHKNSICVETQVPSGISKEVEDKALDIARKIAYKLDTVGVFAVEMFVVGDEILVNEIAPRVHNSAHYTMDACETSQFEQHVRVVTGMELGSTKMKVPAAVMVNILGERDGPVKLNGVEEAEKIDGVSIYIYGKSPTKIDRKMGHINATGMNVKEANQKAHQARKLISI